MASVVKAFPEKSVKHNGYPLDAWLDGRIWKCIKGDDFQNDPVHFAAAIRLAASRRGLKAKALVDGESVFFQAVPVVQEPKLTAEPQQLMEG